jgi:hypothetical protein
MYLLRATGRGILPLSPNGNYLLAANQSEAEILPYLK